MRTVEETDIGTSLPLDTLRAVLREHPVRLAILFGSHTRGTTHPRSDVDIAVEFGVDRPRDPGYNETFLGLSADLSEALATDEVDLVDLHAASPELVTAIFDHGVLLIGDHEHAAELRHQLTAIGSTERSPRDRFDTALAKIDEHLEGGSAAPATGDSDEER